MPTNYINVLYVQIMIWDHNNFVSDMNPARCARDSRFVYGSSTKLGTIVDRMVLEMSAYELYYCLICSNTDLGSQQLC